MKSVKIYKEAGRYTLEPSDPDAEEMILVMADDCYVAQSGSGEWLVYRQHDNSYGKRIQDALAQGWCRILEEGARAA